MPKHVIVDGFNVIRGDSELSAIESINFYGAQNILIQKLAQYRRGTTNRITVVYDGANGPNSFRQRSQREGIHIIYSAQGETADEVIKDLVASDAANCCGYLVITADRDLAVSCRMYRVNVAPPEELLRRSRPGKLTPKNTDYWHGKREEKGWVGHTKKKGNPRKAPKNHRKTQGLW
ncbi:NYN domain-containing protein [bacterium]|nr:NYN domain-containing protein [bacterium]